ncbi:hypothetical protein P5673_011547 [Acropora cervicornis]|uniref:Uncharacterized protein n=1 Tax=Acropora cervicornis TaxID=6130 RepID=A0AAD9QP68_ACRCE|nr:hypothetical protein P5673_015914 [Acropora cervicornis]KAK2564852.1 hypothetical protein P5673_011547 [Acropora cervicornis]
MVKKLILRAINRLLNHLLLRQNRFVDLPPPREEPARTRSPPRKLQLPGRFPNPNNIQSLSIIHQI